MRCLSIIGSIFVGFSSLTYAHAARAQSKVPGVTQVSPNTPAGIFGMQRQVALSSDEGLATSLSSTSDGGGETFKFTFRPAIDYFVLDNMSLGATLGFDYTSVRSAHLTVYSVGPRLGYNVSFTPVFSIWPRVGLSYAARNQTSDFGLDVGKNHLQLNVSVPFMFHPRTHFFVGFGPALDADVSGDVKTTTVAGRVTIGGWF